MTDILRFDAAIPAPFSETAVFDGTVDGYPDVGRQKRPQAITEPLVGGVAGLTGYPSGRVLLRQF